MFDVFTSQWQINDDIQSLKNMTFGNKVIKNTIKLNDEIVELPYTFPNDVITEYQISVQKRGVENEFLYFDCVGEGTVYLDDKAVGSIDYAHNKIYLSRFEENDLNFTVKIIGPYQKIIQYPKQKYKKFGSLDFFEYGVYEIDIQNYKKVLLLEQLFLYFNSKNNDDIILWLRKRLNKNLITNVYYEIDEINDYLIGKLPNVPKYETTFIGNSHLDIAFKWDEDTTIQKNERTNSNFFANYKFDKTKKQILSQGILLKYINEFYDYQKNEFKEMIKENYMEMVISSMTEFDTNIPSSQSIIDNISYGKQILKYEYSRKTSVCFLPDTFGYVQNLPSLLKQNGIDYFVTTKLLWNEQTKFDYDDFAWKNNKDVVNCYCTNRGYGGSIDLIELVQLYNDAKCDVLYLYGEGDGGGGPSIEDFLLIDIFSEKLPFVKVTDYSLEQYMKSLQCKDTLEGELYLQKHRGVYTTGYKIKKAIRDFESIRHHKEVSELLNLLSFHDICSATIVEQAYDKIIISIDKVYKKYEDELKINLNDGKKSSEIYRIELVDKNFKLYSDRAGYFDSWDITDEYWKNEIGLDNVEFDYDVQINELNDTEITINLNQQQLQTLFKINLFDDIKINELICDISYGVKKYIIKNHFINDKSKFEFPYQKFIAFKQNGKYIAVVNTGKYGASFNERLELTLSKTGIYPMVEKDIKQQIKFYIIVCDTLKEVREKSNFYNNIKNIPTDNKFVSCEVVSKNKNVLINNSDEKVDFYINDNSYIIEANGFKIIK